VGSDGPLGTVGLVGINVSGKYPPGMGAVGDGSVGVPTTTAPFGLGTVVMGVIGAGSKGVNGVNGVKGTVEGNVVGIVPGYVGCITLVANCPCMAAFGSIPLDTDGKILNGSCCGRTQFRMVPKISITIKVKMIVAIKIYKFDILVVAKILITMNMTIANTRNFNKSVVV
jgi:hypothetical protein